jgi:hypothetical protein
MPRRKAMGRRSTWTPKDDDQLRALAASGESSAAIAVRLNHRLKLLADGKVSADYSAKLLERSVTSVIAKAHWLHLTLARRLKVKGK